MRSRQEVVMDSGGAISEAGSNIEHFTDGFGGCTAFCAEISQTSPALYGLYHLRSTLEKAPEMVEGVTDSNEPFRNWIRDLKERSQGEKIHFQLGTPWLFGDNKKIMDSHPQLGMERYLRKICAQHEIENYEITLINMIGVESVSITEEGMTCYGYRGEKTNVSPAQYQSDEEILENSGWPNQKCLQFINADPNVDFDGKLKTKYEQRCNIERMEQMKQEMEIQRREMEAKQAEMQNSQRELENQKKEAVNAIKQPMLMTLGEMVTKYQNLFESGPKEDTLALHKYLFIEDLFKAVDSGDLSSLQEMKKLPYFKNVTEVKMPFFFKNEPSEMGNLFNKAEKLLAEIQELLSEETPEYSTNSGGMGLG